VPLWAWILVAVVVVLVVAAVLIYNRLVALRNRVDNGWAQIDVQLRRRYDLIPNLVETVKGYASHEREVFEDVTRARAAAIDATAVDAQATAENQITRGLRQLLAVAEAYPELKANQNMLALQEELGSTENKVAFARQAFNDSVMVYNTARETFPNNIVAGIGGFAAAQPFEIESPKEREAPRVSF
jgi:LemA protein